MYSFIAGHPSWPDPLCATCAWEEGGEKNHLHLNCDHTISIISIIISKVTIIQILTPVPSVQRSSKVSYEEQAKFSISSYPFSMKLLWAPLVDSIYVARSYNLATFKIEICQLLCFNIAQLLLSGLAGESLGWFQFST